MKISFSRTITFIIGLTIGGSKPDQISGLLIAFIFSYLLTPLVLSLFEKRKL